MRNSYVGIVLAGGQSRRYGTPKALERINGIRFYERAIELLEPFVEHIVVVAHPSLVDQLSAGDGIRVITDVEEFLGEGPMAGIYSGMKSYEATHYLVLACDMPLMEQQIFHQLTSIPAFLGQDCSVIPRTEGRLQPLAALYTSSAGAVIQHLLNQKKRRLTDLIRRIDCAYIDYESTEKTRCFQNINTPGDFNEIIT